MIPRWMSRTWVPSPSGVRVTSTVLEPGGTAWSSSQPNVKTTREYGTTSTNSPRRRAWVLMSSAYEPPGRGSASARDPIQRTILFGSTKKANTVSGVAAMRVSLTTALISLTVTGGSLRVLSVVFGGFFQVVERVVPEVAQPCAELPQALGR